MSIRAQPLPPGSTIGILGGGQLGRMLAMAAARLGLKSHVFCPDSDSPAFQVSAGHTIAGYLDTAALDRFAGDCDAVTFEFENVPSETVEVLSRTMPVFPGARSLAVCQDRLEEKRLAEALGIGTAAWRAVSSRRDLDGAMAALGGPALLKTRRLGYDGKGQARIGSDAELDAAWESIAGAPAVLEEMVPFALEVSVIAARGADGDFVSYDPVENSHEGGILRRSRVPARIAPQTAEAAVAIARRIAEALEHVGVLAVELFVIRQGAGEHLLVNEIAPRVHNTGHWTIEACPASQFEAHIRAVAGWPLAAPFRIADAEMINLIGAEADNWLTLAGEPHSGLHLYGKSESRPGRKMGHLTRLFPLGGETGSAGRR